MSVQCGPVGVFDSGLGGLSVLHEMRALLPGEDVLYYADSAHCPYGGRAPDYILGRCTAIMDYLLERGSKLVVVACNTASSVALHELRALYKTPIVGMVPAVKPAATATRSGKVCVLATPRTVTGEALAALIREHARGVEVYTVPGIGLVELVEAGKLEGPEVEEALKPLLCPMLDRGVDTVVLGCTHYPFLTSAIRRLGGPELAIVESGAAVARRTRDVLQERGLLRSGGVEGRVELFTSGERDHVEAVASRLMGATVSVARAAL